MTRHERGFTLMELMIALVLATAISAALVVAFRLGLQYVEKGQRFYTSLQESLAVVQLLRRELTPSSIGLLQGDETSVHLSTGSAVLGNGRKGAADILLRCVSAEGDTGPLQLEQVPMQAPEKPAAGKPPSTPLPDEEKKTVLLDALQSCEFAYLVGDTPKQAVSPAAEPASANDKTTGQPTATEKKPEEQSKTASWQSAWDQPGRPLALRIHIATREQALPPVVFGLVN